MFWKGDPKCKGKPHLGFKFGLVHQAIILNWLYNLFLLINFIFIKQYWEPVIENCLIIIAWLHSNCKYSTTCQLTFSCLSIQKLHVQFLFIKISFDSFLLKAAFCAFDPWLSYWRFFRHLFHPVKSEFSRFKWLAIFLCAYIVA